MKVTNIKSQVKQASRYSIFVDGRYSFSLSDNSLLSSKIVVGLELDEKQLIKLKQLSVEDKAYSNTLRYVSIRMRSEWEIVTYLRRKKINELLSSQIISRLKNNGLIDDKLFASNWVASRRGIKPISRRRLQIELKQKRISQTIIEQVTDEDNDEELGSLKELIKSKRRISRYRDDDLKLMQYLSRQGYNYGDIKQALSLED